MPEKLLSSDCGIPKSLINQITASPDKVLSGVQYIGPDGNLHTGTYVPPNKSLHKVILINKSYTQNLSLDVDCTSISSWNTLTNTNFILQITGVSNGRTDFSQRNDSACTYTGIKIKASSYNAKTGKYHIEIIGAYSPYSNYTANTMSHWNGNEEHSQIIRHLSYGIQLTAVYIN